MLTVLIRILQVIDVDVDVELRAKNWQGDAKISLSKTGTSYSFLSTTVEPDYACESSAHAQRSARRFDLAMYDSSRELYLYKLYKITNAGTLSGSYKPYLLTQRVFSLISFSEASKGTFHTTIFELFCFAKEAGLRCDALLL